MIKVCFSSDQQGELCTLTVPFPFTYTPRQQLNLEYSDGEHMISGLFSIMQVTQTWRYLAPAHEYDLAEVEVTYYVKLQQLVDFTESFFSEEEVEVS